jgi:hypothetical protein
MAARIYLLVRSAEAQKEVKTPAPKAWPEKRTMAVLQTPTMDFIATPR